MKKDQKAHNLVGAVTVEKSSEPSFTIKYGRNLVGTGKDIRLKHLEALVREAQFLGLDEDSQVSLYPYSALSFSTADDGREDMITINEKNDVITNL